LLKVLRAVYSKSTLNKQESIASFYEVSFKVIKPVTSFKLGENLHGSPSFRTVHESLPSYCITDLLTEILQIVIWL